MLSLMEWAMYIITCLIAAGTPGPGTLAVINSSLLHGSRKTLSLMMGIAFGLGIVSVCTLLGLSKILTESKSLFLTLQYVGIAYIIFLGAKSIKQSFLDNSEDRSSTIAKKWGVFSGIWISVLNPKTFLFFAAFFPTYLTKNQDERYFYLGILLTVVLIGCTFSVHIIYSLIGQNLSIAMRDRRKEINLVTGILFIALGAIMAL